MRALCWNGVNDLRVETVPDPALVNPRDVILKVGLTTTCGSDLHFIDGYLPTMREGDVIGHEFMGTVVEIGTAVKNVRVGQRVVVPSFISCGGCWHCERKEFRCATTPTLTGRCRSRCLGIQLPAFTAIRTPLAATQGRTPPTSACRTRMSVFRGA